MSLSYLGRAIAAICSSKPTTALAIAEAANLHHTLVSRACNGARLKPDSLRALCQGQKDKRDGLDILIGHLRDEVDRSGFAETDVTIQADSRSVDSDMRTLAEESLRDPHLLGLLQKMAAMIRSRPLTEYPEGDEENALAAEEAKAPTVVTQPDLSKVRIEALKAELERRKNQKPSSD